MSSQLERKSTVIRSRSSCTAAENKQKAVEPSIMRVFPPVVEFHGVEVGTLYVITITIQNTSACVRRVRFKPPCSKAFTLKNEPKVICFRMEILIWMLYTF